jgi:hypothetical protein
MDWDEKPIGRHIGHDIGDATVDQHQVARLQRVLGQQLGDLRLDAVAGRALHQRVTAGIGKTALVRRHQGQPEAGGQLLAPDVDRAVVDGIALAVLAQVAEAVAHRQHTRGLEGIDDGAGAAGGQQRGGCAGQRQQDAAQRVSCH